jgi:hypothetical protein
MNAHGDSESSICFEPSSSFHHFAPVRSPIFPLLRLMSPHHPRRPAIWALRLPGMVGMQTLTGVALPRVLEECTTMRLARRVLSDVIWMTCSVSRWGILVILIFESYFDVPFVAAVRRERTLREPLSKPKCSRKSRGDRESEKIWAG